MFTSPSAVHYTKNLFICGRFSHSRFFRIEISFSLTAGIDICELGGRTDILVDEITVRTKDVPHGILILPRTSCRPQLPESQTFVSASHAVVAPVIRQGIGAASCLGFSGPVFVVLSEVEIHGESEQKVERRAVDRVRNAKDGERVESATPPVERVDAVDSSPRREQREGDHLPTAVEQRTERPRSEYVCPDAHDERNGIVPVVGRRHVRANAEKDESEPKAYQTPRLDERAREDRPLLF